MGQGQSRWERTLPPSGWQVRRGWQEEGRSRVVGRVGQPVLDHLRRRSGQALGGEGLDGLPVLPVLDSLLGPPDVVGGGGRSRLRPASGEGVSAHEGL